MLVEYNTTTGSLFELYCTLAFVGVVVCINEALYFTEAAFHFKNSRLS